MTYGMKKLKKGCEMKTITDADIKDIKEFITLGYSISKIAQEYNMGIARVKKFLGLTTRMYDCEKEIVTELNKRARKYWNTFETGDNIIILNAKKKQTRRAKILNITATNIITAAESIMFSQIVDGTRKIKKI